jgi:hypothetical protein
VIKPCGRYKDGEVKWIVLNQETQNKRLLKGYIVWRVHYALKFIKVALLSVSFKKQKK